VTLGPRSASAAGAAAGRRPGARLRVVRPALDRFAGAFAISLVVWISAWLLLSLQVYVYYREKGGPVSWSSFAVSLSDYLVWAALTPLVVWAVWDRPIRRADWTRALPLHVAAGVVVCLAHVPISQLAHLALARAFGETHPEGLSFAWLFGAVVRNLFAYVDIVLVGHAIHFYREARDKDLRASQLDTTLAEARLQVLKMQLHPHFLFNTLHSISALVHKDPEAADRMIALLGDLLRHSMENGAQSVPLRQELELLDRYLEIEKTRLRDRLTIDLDVDPETLDGEVPNLILQPIVENAIRHGIARRSRPGRIELRASRQAGMLALQVRDDGPGLPDAVDPVRAGIGLVNTQARLSELYGPRHRFEVRNRDDGGLEVTLAFPFRQRPRSAASGA
jgi:two-component system, LytTR family, sensor kinase